MTIYFRNYLELTKETAYKESRLHFWGLEKASFYKDRRSDPRSVSSTQGNKGGFIRMLLAGLRRGLVYFVLFSHSMRAGPAVCMCV